MVDSTVTNAQRGLELPREFTRRFAERWDASRLRVTLFGSRARDDADEESDLDLFVEIQGDDLDGRARAWADEVAVELTLRHGILFSPLVADCRFSE